MKLVCSITSIKKIIDVKPYVSAILIEDSSQYLEDIQVVFSNGLQPILKWNEMMLPDDIPSYQQKIEATKNLNCYYYITDLGLAHLLKQAGLIERVIYDPVTMITNSLDAQAYFAYGFHAIGLSNEITIEDTKEILQKSQIKAFLQVFGYRIMLSTRRKLISLYQEKMGKFIPKENLKIQELTRKDEYPIVETPKGTKIYRSYMINLLKEMKGLSIEYAFLDESFIDHKVFMQVLNIFSDALKKEDITEQLSLLDSLKLNTRDGFMYQDTVYNKEEF